MRTSPLLSSAQDARLLLAVLDDALCALAKTQEPEPGIGTIQGFLKKSSLGSLKTEVTELIVLGSPLGFEIIGFRLTYMLQLGTSWIA